jgi:hypothetical protein
MDKTVQDTNKTDTIGKEEQNMLEKFNNTFQEFLTDITSTFPKYSEHIKKTFDFNKINVTTEKQYLEFFMDNTKKYIKEISIKDEEFFKKGEKIYFVKGIEFSELWININDEKNKQIVWKYLHTLYIIGNALISDIGNLSDVLKSTGDDSNMKEISEHATIMLNMFNSLSDGDTNLNSKESVEALNNDIDNTSIGKIAQELANEINLDDFGLNLNDSNNANPADLFTNLFSGGNNKLMDLITNVGNKIQSKLESGDIDEEVLMKEAQDMMKNNPLFGNNPLFSNPELMKQMEKGNVQVDQNKVKKQRLRDKLKNKLKLKRNKKK